ncbi:MAG TPA: hypothetical protein DCZ63_06120 [Geobacter sp.]|nr:hypothetical protein [Geobacter sp.]
MIKLCVLGSGSKGNAIYFNVDGRQFLIDAGFTKKETAKRLATIGRSVSDIEQVFITHDHGDHAAPWIRKDGLLNHWCLLHGAEKFVGGAKVTQFPLSHDSGSGSVGYTIQDGAGNKVAVIMDTGCIPEEIIPHLFDCQAILVETNYSIEMLIDSPYPTELQERIASSTGHLRDQCAAEAVEMVAWPGLKYVVGLHLSSKCINETLARFELESVVRDKVPGCEVVISGQKEPTKMMTLI